MKKKDSIKKFWNYIWYDDSIGSYILNFILAFVIIKFLFFPGLGLLLGNDYPIVAIVSGSMEHKITENRICDTHVADIRNKKLDIDEWWSFCGNYYDKNFNLTKEEFSEFEYKNGLNIGDVMVLISKDASKIEIGEVLVFIPEDRSFFNEKGPVIHRVMDKWQDEEGKWHFKTKGDHNPKSFEKFETNIPEEDIIGVSVVRIPLIGYAKLMLNNAFLLLKSTI